jgi:hypothetical protein
MKPSIVKAVLPAILALAVLGAPAAAVVTGQASEQAANHSCMAALGNLEKARSRFAFEQAAAAMAEVGAPRDPASRMPSREAIGAGWVLLTLDPIAAAQSGCALTPEAAERFSQAEVRDTVKAAAVIDRATCRALLQLLFEGARGSLDRRMMGYTPSSQAAAQLRRTLFEDIEPICPDTGSEDLALDVRTATAKDLTAALEAGQ